jgi:hypothetical protein
MVNNSPDITNKRIPLFPTRASGPHGQGQTHYPSQQHGNKLYAVRDSKGRFKDIQTYKRACSADLRHKAKAEK